MVLTFRLTVELFPPLCDEMQFGIEVNEQFHFLALFLVEDVAGSGIERSRVSLKSSIAAANLHHAASAVDKGLDIETCASDRQQTNRRQNRETATDIILDDVGLEILLGSEGSERTSLGVGDADDMFAGKILSFLLLQLGLEQTERQSGLGRRTGFGDRDNTETLVFE